MTTVSDLKGKLMSIDIGSLVKSVVKENEKAIVDLNREDQIFQKGIDANGRSLFKYERSTQGTWLAEYRANLIPNPKGGNKTFGEPYNMFWTGSSYNTFKAYLRGATSLFITAAPFARKRLIDNSSPNIFGLTDDNERIANYDIILPALNEKIKKLL